ncbi:multimerin-2-like [Haliotis rufescens]|uniref:multimerin-2-like n=1 Tax=Haliotis rufescens TaxID=6454 RepID=UPI00201F515B|nr:multimerin-2-like [Haliotis rufescens]
MEKAIICCIFALMSLALSAGSGLDKSSILKSLNLRMKTTERQAFTTALHERTMGRITQGSSQDKQGSGESMNARLEAVERQLLASNQRRNTGMVRNDVSFEVTCSRSRTYTVYGNQIYRFDTVTLNNGGGYHKSTGVFEAPKSGTYLFWASILPYNKKTVNVRLIKEGRQLVNTGSNDASPSSFSYVVHVRREEKVWFEAGGYTTTIYGHQHSSYGGTLIHQQ